jgi:proton-translocating NADH-quinone oxidoreductase chain N
MIYSFYGIPILLAAAFIIPLISFKSENKVPWVAMGGSFIALLLASLTIPGIMTERIITFQMEDWIAPFGITIAVDSLSLLLIMIITSIGFFAAIFSYRFIKEKRTKYYSLLCLFIAGMLGVVHTGDMFNMFVFFEILSLSAYALTSYYRNANAIEGSIKYLLQGSLATSLILFGVAFLYGLTGTLNMADLAVRIPGISSFILPFALGLLLTGLGLKTAMFPFHAWKADVITATPAPIGALFATASTAVGIYTIFRLFLTVFAITSVHIYMLIAGIGVVTMIIGALMALQQRDLLRMLAYSSISQAGFVLLAFGMGIFDSVGYTAAIFHLLNIVILEGLLFFCAGVVIHHAGTSDMGKLGGFARFSPVLNYAFLIGILANAGVPLLNGFSSKWLIYIVTLNTSPILMILAALSSVLALFYGLKAYSLIFLSNKNIKPRKISHFMLIPIVILAGLCIFFGVLPWAGIRISNIVVESFTPAPYIMKVLLW